MNIFTLAKSGRTLLLAAALAVGAVCWVGCGGGDDNNPADNGGNNSGNNNSNNNGSPSGGLVCAYGEAWMSGGGSGCGSATDGLIFKSDGDLVDIGLHDNVWVLEHTYSWQTNGNKLLITKPNGNVDDGTYDISNGALTMTFESGKQSKYNRKCSGVTVGWQ